MSELMGEHYPYLRGRRGRGPGRPPGRRRWYSMERGVAQVEEISPPRPVVAQPHVPQVRHHINTILTH